VLATLILLFSSSNAETEDESLLIFPLRLNMGSNEKRRFGDV